MSIIILAFISYHQSRKKNKSGVIDIFLKSSTRRLKRCISLSTDLRSFNGQHTHNQYVVMDIKEMIELILPKLMAILSIYNRTLICKIPKCVKTFFTLRYRN